MRMVLVVYALAAAFITQSVQAQTGAAHWTGFHVGGSIGAGFGSGVNPQPVNFLDPRPTNLQGFYSNGGFDFSNFTTSGIVGGAQAGYDRQVSNFVFGVEADWSATGISGAHSGYGQPQLGAGFVGSSAVTSFYQSIDWLATFRGRAGYARDSWMVYGTGGLALARVRNTFRIDGNAANNNSNFTYDGPGSTTDNIRAGWTAGGGGAWAFGPWSVKLEYLYFNLGSEQLTAISSNGALAFTPPNTGLVASMTTAGHILRTGINFRF